VATVALPDVLTVEDVETERDDDGRDGQKQRGEEPDLPARPVDKGLRQDGLLPLLCDCSEVLPAPYCFDDAVGCHIRQQLRDYRVDGVAAGSARTAHELHAGGGRRQIELQLLGVEQRDVNCRIAAGVDLVPGQTDDGKRVASEPHAVAELEPRRAVSGQLEMAAADAAAGDELGRTPTGKDLDERRATLPSKSLYWQRFGSLSNALRAAGFDVPRRDERAERALEQGRLVAQRLGRLPRFADWRRARSRSPAMLSEWQVYRLFADGRGGWTAFRAALRERLARSGVDIGADGRLAGSKPRGS